MQLEFKFERGGVLQAQLADEAKQTVACVSAAMPMNAQVLQARWSGREVFVPMNLPRKPPRERQSIRAGIGDVIYFTEWPNAYEQTGFESIGIFYGPEIVREWRGDAPVNVFGHIDSGQWDLLRRIGERVWRNGSEGIAIRVVGA